MRQDVCRFREESHDRRVLWCDNDISAHSGLSSLWEYIYPRLQQWKEVSLGPSGARGLCLFACPSGLPSIPIPLVAFQICVFKQHVSMEMGFTTMSLFYGTKTPYSFFWRKRAALIVP